VTPIEIIAKKMIHRASADGEIACGHRLGGSDATAILMAIESAGFVIVPKEPTAAMLAAAHRNNHPRDAETWSTMVAAAVADLDEASAAYRLQPDF
jgi:hypothetical protein